MPQRVYILHGKRFKQKPEIRNFSGGGGRNLQRSREICMSFR